MTQTLRIATLKNKPENDLPSVFPEPCPQSKSKKLIKPSVFTFYLLISNIGVFPCFETVSYLNYYSTIFEPEIGTYYFMSLFLLYVPIFGTEIGRYFYFISRFFKYDTVSSPSSIKKKKVRTRFEPGSLDHGAAAIPIELSAQMRNSSLNGQPCTTRLN